MNTVLEIVRLGMLINKEKISRVHLHLNDNVIDVRIFQNSQYWPYGIWTDLKFNGSDDDKLLEILAYLRNLLGDKYIDNGI
jgi:hypothetical protein